MAVQGPRGDRRRCRRLFPERRRPRVHAVRRGRLPAPAGDRDAVGLHGRGRVRAVHLPGHRGRAVARPRRGGRRRSTAARAGWRPATSCGWRWATRCTGRTCSRPRRAFEAGLSWAVAMDKGGFRGRGGLERQRREGLPSRLRGLRMARAAPHPARALPGVRRRPRRRRGHERDVLAAARDGDRARVPVAGRRGRARRRGRGGHPRAARARRPSCGRRSWTATRG